MPIQQTKEGIFIMKIFICDDEQCILDSMKEKTKRLFPDAAVRTFLSGEALLDAECDADIVLLDICLRGMSGMDVARKLRETRPETALIFVTADSSFVFDAFDVGAFHYLVKPFSDEKFAEVMKNAAKGVANGAREKMREKEDGAGYVMVRHKGVHTKICVDEIVYAEVYNRKVVIHTTKQDVEYYGKLTELANALGGDFVRTHRAYLVHMKYVTRYDAASVTLGDKRVLMAKANFPEFVRKYLNYNRRKGGRR